VDSSPPGFSNTTSVTEKSPEIEELSEAQTYHAGKPYFAGLREPKELIDS
jgi:hypothetical protein